MWNISAAKDTHFLKHNLKIAFLYGCSAVEPGWTFNQDGSFTTRNQRTSRHWQKNCLRLAMDFHKSFYLYLFQIYNNDKFYISQLYTLTQLSISKN